ncbi:MAG TPA: hypothetical protein VKW08_10135 [Xanthobacteraceae bacterium]|nr:hypothetical protein [Xanthobacteraceae bacterium]
MAVAQRCQKLLFTAYRLDAYADPEMFQAQVAAVFSQYSDAVLIRATDPLRRDCIQRTHKFPPSIQEIGEALDGFEKTEKALAFVEERVSRGFTWNGTGFFNANGEKYDAAKHRALPQIASQPLPLTTGHTGSAPAADGPRVVRLDRDRIGSSFERNGNRS